MLRRLKEEVELTLPPKVGGVRVGVGVGGVGGERLRGGAGLCAQMGGRRWANGVWVLAAGHGVGWGQRGVQDGPLTVAEKISEPAVCMAGVP